MALTDSSGRFVSGAAPPKLVGGRPVATIDTSAANQKMRLDKEMQDKYFESQEEMRRKSDAAIKGLQDWGKRLKR